jgi:hypothetical protein
MKLTMVHGGCEDNKVECTILDLNLVVASFLTYLMIVRAPYLPQWLPGQRTLLSLPSERYVDIHIVGITPHLALLA